MMEFDFGEENHGSEVLRDIVTEEVHYEFIIKEEKPEELENCHMLGFSGNDKASKFQVEIKREVLELESRPGCEAKIKEEKELGLMESREDGRELEQEQMVVLVDTKEEEAPVDEDSLHPEVPQSQFADPLQSNHVCEDCGKTFEYLVQYKSHKKYHQLVRNHKCDWPECGKTFVSKSMLAGHKVTHTGEKAFQCTEKNCMKSFGRKSELKRHLLTHAGEKPFQCTEEKCLKRFPTKYSLNQHQLVHTGKKPFQCTEKSCLKTFLSKSHLNTHQLVHTGEKPFQCTEEKCLKSFSTKFHLNRHQLVHTGEKPFHCECGKAFNQKSSLNSHMLIHKKNQLKVKSQKEELGGEGQHGSEREPGGEGGIGGKGGVGGEGGLNCEEDFGLEKVFVKTDMKVEEFDESKAAQLGKAIDPLNIIKLVYFKKK